MAFGTHTPAGLSAALFVVFLRTFGLGLMSMGLALARTEAPDDTFVSLTSLAWRRPWAAVGLVVGAFSLAGVPPLAGFAGRWGALQQAAGSDLGASLALVLSSIGVVAGMMRGLQYVLRPIDDPSIQPVHESTLTVAVLVGALVLCVIFGLFPDLLHVREDRIRLLGLLQRLALLNPLETVVHPIEDVAQGALSGQFLVRIALVDQGVSHLGRRQVGVPA